MAWRWPGDKPLSEPMMVISVCLYELPDTLLVYFSIIYISCPHNNRGFVAAMMSTMCAKLYHHYAHFLNRWTCAVFFRYILSCVFKMCSQFIFMWITCLWKFDIRLACTLPFIAVVLLTHWGWMTHIRLSKLYHHWFRKYCAASSITIQYI